MTMGLLAPRTYQRRSELRRHLGLVENIAVLLNCLRESSSELADKFGIGRDAVHYGIQIFLTHAATPFEFALRPRSRIRSKNIDRGNHLLHRREIVVGICLRERCKRICSCVWI